MAKFQPSCTYSKGHSPCWRMYLAASGAGVTRCWGLIRSKPRWFKRAHNCSRVSSLWLLRKRTGPWSNSLIGREEGLFPTPFHVQDWIYRIYPERVLKRLSFSSFNRIFGLQATYLGFMCQKLIYGNIFIGLPHLFTASMEPGMGILVLYSYRTPVMSQMAPRARCSTIRARVSYLNA